MGIDFKHGGEMNAAEFFKELKNRDVLPKRYKFTGILNPHGHLISEVGKEPFRFINRDTLQKCNIYNIEDGQKLTLEIFFNEAGPIYDVFNSIGGTYSRIENVKSLKVLESR